MHDNFYIIAASLNPLKSHPILSLRSSKYARYIDIQIDSQCIYHKPPLLQGQIDNFSTYTHTHTHTHAHTHTHTLVNHSSIFSPLLFPFYSSLPLPPLMSTSERGYMVYYRRDILTEDIYLTQNHLNITIHIVLMTVKKLEDYIFQYGYETDLYPLNQNQPYCNTNIHQFSPIL